MANGRSRKVRRFSSVDGSDHHKEDATVARRATYQLQECPICGGQVEIGLAGMVRVGSGPEEWAESGGCLDCRAVLVRQLVETDRPVVFMKRSDWRPAS